MSSCPTCGNRDYLCQSCKMEELEDRHGRPSDNFDEDTDGVRCWVQAIDETWHASMYFEGTRHAAACGECFETPVADVRDDPRRLADERTCDDCEAYLEVDDDETVPDGGEFSLASELWADGGEVEVYQWVLENIHEYPAWIDSRWGSRGNLVHHRRKLDGVTKEDVQVAISRAVDNEDLLSWHGLLARAEIDRLREITRVEHEEHNITRGILVGKCNKLIAMKKQEQADENAEREVATDGGVDQPLSGVCPFESSRRVKLVPPHLQKSRPIFFGSPSMISIPGWINPHRSQIRTIRFVLSAILSGGITTGYGNNLPQLSRSLKQLLQSRGDQQ
ncbi:hypothetical protein [Natrinema soli]|uniref:Uncharacterized protein n=1 Tax=Natrinema soli TaxID=1930624 RepID=A0ABD5SLT9_9EURY|nr:hypothetical protein [Natrinema soli]